MSCSLVYLEVGGSDAQNGGDVRGVEAKLGARLGAMLEARMFRGSWENIETGGWLGEGLGTRD